MTKLQLCFHKILVDSVGNQYSREGQPVLFGFVIVVVLLLLLLLDKINLLFFVLEAPPGFPLENLSIIFFLQILRFITALLFGKLSNYDIFACNFSYLYQLG